LAARRAFSIAAHHYQTEPGLSVLPEHYGQIETTIRACLRDVLGLSEARVAAFHDETPLFGALPELDSMAVAGLLTEIEERLGILIEDDEVDGEMLESFGALVRFAAAHTAS
jgi:acyl carrier protein